MSSSSTKSSSLPPKFEWLTFTSSTQEINYLTDFLEHSKGTSLDFRKLNLEFLQEQKDHHPDMQEIIRDQYSRIVKYGNISSFQELASKNEKGKENENEYDLNDSFIDDDDIDKGLLGMQGYQGNLTDYLCIKGNFFDLMKNPEYKERIKQLEEIRLFSLEDKQIYLTKEKKARNKKKPTTKSKKAKDQKKKDCRKEDDEIGRKERLLKDEERLEKEEKRDEGEEKKEKGKKSVKEEGKKSVKDLKRKRENGMEKGSFLNSEQEEKSKSKFIG